MGKYIICVLSGRDTSVTSPRIEKGNELYYKEPQNSVLVYNGFNTALEHDPGFKGDYQNDERLKPFIEEIMQFHPYILYARTTEENAFKLSQLIQKLSEKEKIEKIIVVSSRSHIDNLVFGKPGRVKQIFSKLCDFPYEKLEFVGVEEPNKSKNAFYEVFANFTTFFELLFLPKKNIKTLYKKVARRKEVLSLLSKPIKEILFC